MTDSAPGQKARELLVQASQHPVASPQRNALVTEAAVWARLEHTAEMDNYAAAAIGIKSALTSLAGTVQKLGSAVGDLTEHVKRSQK
ncbi:hypothetical protein ABZ826_09680 [Streptomyces sp. NPDC047515]|uniref:hypothetical protein n=1 Tax=Streptomyces sp. NPDC047515 TaxID=3155380 RepID=UPI00340C0991